MTDTTPNANQPNKTIPTRMAHVTMRIPQETWDFYKESNNPRAVMRDILVAYANRCIERGLTL